ncbi:peroxiredoxin-like family protein [Sulfitobacter guttiformis]|uniref:Peroxiredoxin n=1 Tax=Sulfitobacter guttiformis TaxID=74349 RepID=A0A420DNE3_9RHOB|nr:peroxiredoxin-like family protein [Sulfitobacter guttiformis]KIN73086.1 Thioredoxin peroxidase [Sulfitobacter guttiformis KCTC 32187]RKE95772.1 peroxiredoxin [Sulfitobacter guttiformis]
MTALAAGSIFPKTEVHTLGGETTVLGTPRGGHDWQLVVVYRGLHCPICKTYLAKLQEVEQAFNAQGVDVIAVSADPKEKAQAFADEKDLTIAMGYGLTLEQMGTLGLYISEPRSPQETDRPFAEPGVFVINAEGAVQIIDVSNAPFARPDLEGLANGIKFVRNNDYPIRGTFEG